MGIRLEPVAGFRWLPGYIQATKVPAFWLVEGVPDSFDREGWGGGGVVVPEFGQQQPPHPGAGGGGALPRLHSAKHNLYL